MKVPSTLPVAPGTRSMHSLTLLKRFEFTYCQFSCDCGDECHCMKKEFSFQSSVKARKDSIVSPESSISSTQKEVCDQDNDDSNVSRDTLTTYKVGSSGSHASRYIDWFHEFEDTPNLLCNTIRTCSQISESTQHVTASKSDEKSILLKTGDWVLVTYENNMFEINW